MPAFPTTQPAMVESESTDDVSSRSLKDYDQTFTGLEQFHAGTTGLELDCNNQVLMNTDWLRVHGFRTIPISFLLEG